MLALVDVSGISFLFALGVLFFPKIMMLWTGAVSPGSVGAIAAFIFVPRIMICALLTAQFGDNLPGSMIVLWTLAVIFDVITLIVRGFMSSAMVHVQMEAFNQARMRAGF
jgi:hypothetical protein